MRSLELNWLRNEDKTLVLPEIVFTDIEEYGGCYYRAQQGEVLIDERLYDTRNGIIVISSVAPENIPSTIAHEWRHHWQYFQGWEYDGIGWNSPVNYASAIYDYFTNSYCELDALLFEYRKAKNETTEYWREILETARF